MIGVKWENLTFTRQTSQHPSKKAILCLNSTQNKLVLPMTRSLGFQLVRNANGMVLPYHWQDMVRATFLSRGHPEER